LTGEAAVLLPAMAKLRLLIHGVMLLFASPFFIHGETNGGEWIGGEMET
jgi:hypothetical protein